MIFFLLDKRIPPPDRLHAMSISRLSTDRRQLEYMVQLSKALMTSAYRIAEHLQSHIGASIFKASRSLASLPDELLGIIFKYATHHGEEGTRHAVWALLRVTEIPKNCIRRPQSMVDIVSLV